MGNEKNSASRNLDLEQAPLEAIKVDGQESRVVPFYLRLAQWLECLGEWLRRIGMASYAWDFLVVVRNASSSYPDYRTASRLTEGQIEEGKRLSEAGWYYVQVTPSHRGMWIPRSAIWAAVALVGFGWWRNKPWLMVARVICFMFMIVFSILKLCSH
ncbi:uncharacterized protein JCM15063_006465 [Sporobolomyces koalae]|uniref:uncharacterized protein n=1 Tax=Sporobolomyces koalae TaxID=500713 RepID=UPI003176386C